MNNERENECLNAQMKESKIQEMDKKEINKKGIPEGKKQRNREGLNERKNQRMKKCNNKKKN